MTIVKNKDKFREEVRESLKDPSYLKNYLSKMGFECYDDYFIGYTYTHCYPSGIYKIFNNRYNHSRFFEKITNYDLKTIIYSNDNIGFRIYPNIFYKELETKFTIKSMVKVNYRDITLLWMDKISYLNDNGINVLKFTFISLINLKTYRFLN